MKKLSFLVAVLMIASVLLSACGGAATTAAPTNPPAATAVPTKPPAPTTPPTQAPAPTAVPPTAVPTAVPFKVGFVTDTGGISDKSFNETQWNGIVAGCKEFGCETKYIVSNSDADYVPNLTTFASEGYQLVQAAGFFLGDALAKVAPQYPDVNFTIFDYTYDPCIANVEGQAFKTDQAGYLAGYLAAGMTKTGKIGTFGGAKIPTVTIFMVGFQKGMEAYNAAHGTSVTLLGWDNATGEGVFTGDFQDQVKGKEATQSLFDEGADIFMPVGGQIGIPGFDVARERGGFGIWVDTDGFISLSGVQDVILTSVMKVMDVSAASVIKDQANDQFKGCTNYIGDLNNGGVGIAPYHDLDSKVPADLKAEIDALKAKIISGELADTGCVSTPDWCPTGLYK
jgi:basic membrane protein A